MSEDKSMVFEMAGVICVYGMLVELGGIFFVKDKLMYSTGLWLGIALAIFMLGYMFYVLDTGLSQPSPKLAGTVRKHFIIRYLIVIVVYILIIVVPLGNPLSCFAGIMGLKVAAYLYPLSHRLCTRFRKQNDGRWNV